VNVSHYRVSKFIDGKKIRTCVEKQLQETGFQDEEKSEAFEGAVEKGILKSEALSKDVLTGFLGEFGRKFYGEPASKRKIRITAGQDRVMEALKFGKDEEKIVPFRRKEPVYTLEWI
jgi:hypothetical protein